MKIANALMPTAGAEAPPNDTCLLARLRWESRRDGAYLVPLRIFIGIGWLRAAAEKAGDPGWFDGGSLALFLTDRLQGGDVALPPYEVLIRSVFLPNVVALAWLVLVGQVLAGVAIICGAFTNAALAAGVFMNLNFLLAGEPNPSAFYVVIQGALLCAGTGAVLGLDAWLGNVGPLRGLVARTSASRYDSPGGWTWPAIAVTALALAGYALVHVEDWSPAGSVHDPAMVVAVLSSMTASWAAIACLRGEPRRRVRSIPLVDGAAASPVVSSSVWAPARTSQLPLGQTVVLSGGDPQRHAAMV